MYESTRKEEIRETSRSRVQYAKAETPTEIRTPTFFPVPMMPMMYGSSYSMGYHGSPTRPMSIDPISSQNYDFSGKLSPVYVISQVRSRSRDLVQSRDSVDYSEGTYANARRHRRLYSKDYSDDSEAFASQQRHKYTRSKHGNWESDDSFSNTNKLHKSRNKSASRIISDDSDTSEIKPMKNANSNQFSAPPASSPSSDEMVKSSLKQPNQENKHATNEYDLRKNNLTKQAYSYDTTTKLDTCNFEETVWLSANETDTDVDANIIRKEDFFQLSIELPPADISRLKISKILTNPSEENPQIRVEGQLKIPNQASSTFTKLIELPSWTDLGSLSYRLERRHQLRDLHGEDANRLPEDTRNNLILMGRQEEPIRESPSIHRNHAFATYSEMPEADRHDNVPLSDKNTIYAIKGNFYHIRFRLDPQVERDSIRLTDDHLEDTIKVTFQRHVEFKAGKDVLSTEINRVFKLYRTDVDVHRTKLSIKDGFVHLDAPFKAGFGVKK